MEVRHTRSATKHRISRVRSAFVVHNADLVVPISTPSNTPAGADKRTLHLGPDSQGVLLEVVTVEDLDHPGGVIVIHAMQMRERYRKMLH